MKSLVAMAMLLLALSFCSVLNRRGNNNANTNAQPSPGDIAESSPTPAEVPPAPPSPPAQASNRNTNAAPRLDLRSVPTPPPTISEPPHSTAGPPGVRTLNQNSAASAPPPPAPKPSIPKAPISGGVLNGKATYLPKPAYPPIAKAAHVSGTVNVRVTIDENGNVISASAVSGHPLLQGSAVAAARQAKFSPTKLSGQPVKVTGVLVYNFVE